MSKDEIKIKIESFDSIKAQLAKLLLTCFSETLKESGLPVSDGVSVCDFIQILERPPENNLGDYAFPCFRFAKILRKKPDLIAESLKDKLLASGDPLISNIQVVGAFLNLSLSKKMLAEETIPKILSKEYFTALAQSGSQDRAKTMVEFSQPNTHKEFHVGHGRNVCLGDSICRIYEYCGLDLIRANYLGDEGTHVAKAIWQIKRSEKKPDGVSPVEFYGSCYVLASKSLRESSEDERKKIEEEISLILSNLESKEGSDYDLWQKTRQECLDEFSRIYKWLDVKFDVIFYESEVSEESQNIVDEFIQKGLFKESKGAIGIDMEDEGLGFFMARKSDGTTPYITKDLALARRKFEDFNIDRSVYVVGSEQQFHFKQLFEALKQMGFQQASKCSHLSYAHVVLTEGKMSSRSGNTFTFKDLESIMEKEIHKKLKRYEGEWTSKDIEETAHLLSLGSIKYGMLSSDPNKEIVFDPDLWTSFEGDTGPYLMYSYARTISILKKSQINFDKDSFDFKSLSSLTLPLEFDLIRKMYDFNDAVRQAIEQMKPSSIAHYLFELCKVFNRFYVNVSVLKAEDEDLKKARLALLKAFSNVLKEGLFLLGITPPERM